MNPISRQLLILLISAVLAVTGFLQGFVIWDYFGVKGEVAKTAMTIGLSLLIIAVGFLLSIFDLICSVKDEIVYLRRNIRQEALSSLANFDPLQRHTGTDALMILAERLPQAKLVLNTRFTPKGFGPIYTKGTAIWNEQIHKCVKNGLTFREIVSDSGVAAAKELIEKLKTTKTLAGDYTCTEIILGTKSCMNFIVLHMKDGNKEVWFGWVLSHGARLEKLSFKSTDRDVVAMFEDWHASITSDGNVLY